MYAEDNQGSSCTELASSDITQSNNMSRRATKTNLLLAFDAFGTLFAPRQPIVTQYGDVARRHGLNGFTDDELHASFRRAFKEESLEHPNYGKNVGMTAPQWWSSIISRTFIPFLPKDTPLPNRLVPDLLHRFSSKDGYSVFLDTMSFFQKLRELKNSGNDKEWPWKRTIVGVITNSDDRIPGILESFGLKIGSRRIGRRNANLSIDESEDINFVVLSYDVGFEKPDKRIFEGTEKLVEEMITGSGVKLADFDKVFVGDEPQKDALGASSAGWHGIYVNRSEQFWNDKLPSSRIIHHEGISGSGKGSYEIIRDFGELVRWRP